MRVTKHEMNSERRDEKRAEYNTDLALFPPWAYLNAKAIPSGAWPKRRVNIAAINEPIRYRVDDDGN